MSVFPLALYLAPAERPFAWLFISLRRWLGGRRYSKNCGGPCFRFWSAVRCSRAAPISRTTALRELAKQPNLAHLKESVLEDYEEGAEE